VTELKARAAIPECVGIGVTKVTRATEATKEREAIVVIKAFGASLGLREFKE
jgi:hypothetical protein